MHARTVRGYSCILAVRAFPLRWPFEYDHSLPCANRPFDNCSPPLLATLEFPTESGSLPASLVSSIVSRYSTDIGGAASHPISVMLPLCSQFRSNQASLACRHLLSPLRSVSFCLACGKSALSAWLWLSSRTLRGHGCILRCAPSLTQSPET